MIQKIHLLILCIVVAGAVAHAQTPWNGSTSAPAVSGTTYTINTAEELAWIAQESQTRDFKGYTLLLEADIDLGWQEATPQIWTPIGSPDLPFAGEFNGQNHVIRNIYLMGNYAQAGLFAATSSEAVVHNVAIAQGLIYTDGTNNVGSLIGINNGTLHHCFNMSQINARNGNRIGGLVGQNKGTINYCYNTGIITDANNFVGGLVGANLAGATVSNCYNTGYTKGAGNAGALFGSNEAGATITNVYFDQQMARSHASGAGENDPTISNTDHAIPSTIDFLTLYTTIAETDTEWDVSYGAYYPELSCFAGHEASKVSVFGIRLDKDELPIERADGVGAPKAGNNPRKEFWMCYLNGEQATWASENNDVIDVSHFYLGKGTVNRPCTTQEVLLSVSKSGYTKTIYTQVKGYDQFDAGILAGMETVCWNEVIKLSNSNKSPGKEPSGGKDDEQNYPTDYQYIVHMYEIITDEEGNETRTWVQDWNLDYKGYQDFVMPTDRHGHFVFTREVHDYQCHTEYATSLGEFHLIVLAEFDPGELCQLPDTIYGVPVNTTVLSCRDATGGGGEFVYSWKYTQLQVDYANLKVDTILKDATVREGYTEVSTATCPVHLTKAGEYIYERSVKEESCKTGTMPSKNEHRIILFDSIYPGRIVSADLDLCTIEVSDTIFQDSIPNGGNGRYRYQWLCNGVILPGCDTTYLPLSSIPFEAGQTYVLQRQVTDDTGIIDFLTSEGEVRISIFQSFDPGTMRSTEISRCVDPATFTTQNIELTEQNAVAGDGDFEYCYLLSIENEDARQVLDTLRSNTVSLSSEIKIANYPAFQLPATLIVQRLVQNAYCKSQWLTSKGEALYHIGADEQLTETIAVCELDMPYTGTYTYQNGKQETYTLHQDGEEVLFHDQTAEGCKKEVTLVCAVRRVPVVELSPINSVCEGDTLLYIDYQFIEGSADHYRIQFDEATAAQGFLPVDTLLPTGNRITVNAPVAAIGTYSLTIQFYNKTEGGSTCDGHEQTISFSIDLAGYVHQKWSDVLFVDNSDKNCEPDCESDLTFTQYQWYKDGEPVEDATGQYYFEEGGLNGVYHVILTTADGTTLRTCDYEIRPNTAIDNIQPTKKSNLQIYPNPLSDGMPLILQSSVAGQIKIYNAAGTTLCQQQMQPQRQEVSVALPTGIYLIQFMSENGQTQTSKLIVK